MINFKKLVFTYIGLAIGLSIFFVINIAMKLNIYYISDLFLYLPNKIANSLFNEGLSPSSVIFVSIFILIIYPILFGLIGYLIDVLRQNKKKSKK